MTTRVRLSVKAITSARHPCEASAGSVLMNEASIAYALTQLPLPVGVLGAAVVSAVVGLVASRQPVAPPEFSMPRRVLAFGLPLFVLISLLTLALARAWSAFDRLEDATDREAAALVAVARFAHALPEPERLEVRALARRYATRVTDDEFQAMEHGEKPPVGSPELDALAARWSRAAVSEQLRSDAFAELARVDQLRRQRHAAVTPAVPTSFVLLGLLALVASTVVASEVLAGPPRIRTVVTSLLVLVTLSAGLLVFQFSLPFAGDLSIDADAFVDAANELR